MDRELVAGALEVMVHDRWPVSVEPVHVRTRSVEGGHLREAVLWRARADEAVSAVLLEPAEWDGRRAVVWVDPRGRAALFAADGRTPAAAVRELLARGVAVAAADLFLTGDVRDAHPQRARRSRTRRSTPVTSTVTTAACSVNGSTTC